MNKRISTSSGHARVCGKVAAIFADELHLEVPGYDADLIETGILDSLQLVELLLRLEHRFSITVPLEEIDLDAFRSIRRIAQFVASRNGRSGAMQHSSSWSAAGAASPKKSWEGQ